MSLFAARDVEISRTVEIISVVTSSEGGTKVAFEYDTEDQLTAVVNEAGERYEFEVDASGNVKAEIGFNGFRRFYFFDQPKMLLIP